MIRYLIRTFWLALLFTSLSQAAPPAGYYLVWSDEFSGSALDPSKWGHWLTGTRRDAVNAATAVAVGGGNLVITTYTSNSTHYTGMIATDTKFRTKFGYWEASIDWNDTAGMWSAYWMQSPTMGADISDPVTSGSEIDIAEHRLIDGSSNNIANKIQVNIHWNGYGANHVSQGSGNVGSSLNTGYHTYGFLWTPTAYRFIIDGTTNWSGGTAPVSHSSEFMILSSEVEDGSWAGNIPTSGYGNLGVSTTKMTVDYVRYYAHTNTFFWTGGASAYWTNSANWISNKIPGAASDLTFSYLSTANLSNFLGTNVTVDSLTVLETSSAFSVNGTNTLTLGASGVDMISLSKDAAFNCPVVMGAAQTWTIGNSRKLTVNRNLSGTGLLTKAGKGTLAVGISNTIAKSIMATDGYIGMSAGATNQLALAATGNGGVKAYVGASPGRCATLSLTNANLDFDFGTVSGMPGIALSTSSLNLSGTNDVNITGLDLPLTNLTLLTYTTKAGSGIFRLGTLPAGAAATLIDTGSALVLSVTVWPQVLTWHGAASGTWNTNRVTLDWDAGANVYHEYASSADSVVFADSAADFSVTLSQAVNPAAVTVDNDTAAYTFSPPGKISGATTFVKRGTNSVALNTTNNFTGNTTISEGKLVVGSTGGLYQYAGGNNITVNRGGTLSLQGNIGWQSKALGWLAVQSSGLVLDGGTLQHTGNSNAKSSDGAGHLFTVGASGATLDSATAGQTFAIGYRYDYSTTLNSSSGGSLALTGAGNGDLNYAFPGTGRLLKSGTGAWALTVANTFTGPTTVSAGVLNLQHGSALGGTANGTVVENNARLELQGNITVAGEPLTISGKGGASFYNGALNSKSGSNAWTGPVTLGANETRIGAESGATLMVSGVIDDAGQTNSLVVRSTDSTSRVILSGANTYQGATWLIAGNLQLVGGNSRLPSGTTLVLGGAGEVQLDFNGCHQEISGLATNGTTPSNLTNSSAGLVNLTVNSPLGQPSLYPGRIVGNIALTKNGPEVVKLTGTNTFTGGTTIVQGALLLNSPGLLGSPVALSGGVFGGNGTVDAPLTVNGGTHAPGDFVGVMTVNSNYTLNAGGSLQVKLFGPTPGTQYDQLRVNGSGSLIKLAGTLQILSTNDLPAGTNFVIISNAGSNPVNGAFAGHPQGSAFVVSNNWFRINYAGGDGNDVVLACIAKPAAPMVYLGWTNRQPYLTTASLTNVNYQILISTNLANWNPIFTTNPSDQPLIWNDTQASNGAGRFYRISIGQ